MSNKERDRISFRLRNVDGDLREATKGLDSDKLSDLARDGLRLILGIRTTKSARIEIAERPIVIKTESAVAVNDRPSDNTSNTASDAKIRPQTIRSKPAIYTNKQKRNLT